MSTSYSLKNIGSAAVVSNAVKGVYIIKRKRAQAASIRTGQGGRMIRCPLTCEPRLLLGRKYLRKIFNHKCLRFPCCRYKSI